LTTSDWKLCRPLEKPFALSSASPPHRRLHEISPLIYGQFIEHLGRCIYGGIWAEMLRNRKMHGSVQENGVVEQWQPFGENARWHTDHVEFFVGGQSQVIVGTGSGEHGIAQDGLNLLPKPYVGRVIVKGSGVSEVTVSLRVGDKVLAAQTLKGVTGRWKKLPFRLSVKEAVKGGTVRHQFQRQRNAVGWGCFPPAR